MGENQNQPFQLSFNPVLKVDFQGSRVTSDGGVILVRELDERLGLGDLIAEHLGDLRRGKNTQLQERGISVASTSSAHCAKRAHARLRAFSTSTASRRKSPRLFRVEDLAIRNELPRQGSTIAAA